MSSKNKTGDTMRKTIILSESEIRKIISRVHRMGGLINENLDSTKEAYIGKFSAADKHEYDIMVAAMQNETEDIIVRRPGDSPLTFEPIDTDTSEEFVGYLKLIDSGSGVPIFSAPNGLQFEKLIKQNAFIVAMRPWIEGPALAEFLSESNPTDSGYIILKTADIQSPTGPSEKSRTGSGLEAFVFAVADGKVYTVMSVYNPYHIAKLIVHYMKKFPNIEQLRGNSTLLRSTAAELAGIKRPDTEVSK